MGSLNSVWAKCPANFNNEAGKGKPGNNGGGSGAVTTGGGSTTVTPKKKRGRKLQFNKLYFVTLLSFSQVEEKI